MTATFRPFFLKSRLGIRPALLLLAMVPIAHDGSGATTSIDGSIASSRQAVGANGLLGRPYTPDFIEKLDRLESPDPGGLPEATPGKLEVTLSSWPQRDKYRVSLDTSHQVFSLSSPEKEVYGSTRLAPAMATHDPNSRLPSGKFCSASLLAFKAKQFDDGLYAAVELAVDRGAGRFGSRRSLLGDLVTALAAGPGGAGSNEALGLLSAATRLGGHAVEVPAAAKDVATSLEQEFLANPLRSKPIGFYTWSPDLIRIFQRDRLLQTILEPGTAMSCAGALAGEADLLARYQAALRLPERLTNGFANEALAEAAAGLAADQAPALDNLALFPASRAYETDLVEKLFRNKRPPAGFDLSDEMVRRIQSGVLNLEPREDSGWYDYQTHALEPLVIPDKMTESRHLRLDDSYQKELVKLFKGLLALTRESHPEEARLIDTAVYQQSLAEGIATAVVRFRITTTRKR